MNKGKIVRKGFTLYLKVIGEPLDKPAYFEIQNFATKDKIKEIAQLSDEFDIVYLEKNKGGINGYTNTNSKDNTQGKEWQGFYVRGL